MYNHVEEGEPKDAKDGDKKESRGMVEWRLLQKIWKS